MKKLKVNLMLVVALVIGATTMSFRLVNASNTWHFTGDTNSPGAYANPDNWEPGTAEDEFECVTGGDKPCEIEVEAEDKTELADILDGMSNQDVLNLNPTSRRF